MMKTPAQRHRERVLARQASANAAAENRPLADANAYELMLAKLDTDRRRLKTLQSVERKIAAKREMLPDYAPWIEGVLASGAGVQDDVLMTIMVWRIDIGDHAGALPIAAYALKHGLSLPDQYRRTLGCLIAEEVADGALKAVAAKQPADVDALLETDRLIAEEDMPDEVRAKLHKAIGLATGDDNPIQAVDYLKSALTLNDKAGVKKEIERLERVIKNLAADAAETGVPHAGRQGEATKAAPPDQIPLHRPDEPAKE